MTTYNTYQEAKIANPESLICKFGDKFTIDASRFGQALQPCNPADYCMTVERFLADGYRFQAGDWYIENDDSANKIDHDDVEIMNETSKYDATIYILRAAALKEKKPRTKVKWIDVHHSDAVYYFTKTNDDMYAEPDESQKYDDLQDYINNLEESGSSSLYRRIETTMTWKEELYDYLDNSCEMSDDFDDSFTIEIEGKPLEFNLNDDEFVDMCKLVASLNSVN